MPKNMSQIPDFVGFLFENVIILIQKGLNEEFFEFLVYKAKSLSE